MADFHDEDLKGSRFRNVDLSEALFRNVDLTGAKISGASFQDAELSGDLHGLMVNGVEVGPLVEAELNRRYPERAKMAATDRQGFLEAWDILERLWDETVARARRLPPEKLHESVNDEWSFIETLRHLVFATDAWITRVVLGEPAPWHPWGLPHDEMPDIPGIPRDRAARPTLNEILEVRADRMATVRRVFEEIDDKQLTEMTEPVMEPGYPEPGRTFPVIDCFQVITEEEWEHRLFAERDLAELEKQTH